jgi:hypothetical protein
LIDVSGQDLSPEIDQLLKNLIPETITKSSVLELNIILEEKDFGFKAFADFLLITDKWYGHLHPGGLAAYQAAPEAQLQISHLRRGASELLISKDILKVSDAQGLFVLWLLLKYLPRLQSFLAHGPKVSEEILLELENPLLTKKNIERIEHALGSDDSLGSFSRQSLQKLSGFLCSLYHREYRCLNTAIHFSNKNIVDLSLKFRASLEKKPEEKKQDINNRVFTEKTVFANLIHGEDEYEAQLIEYSSNGNGLSLFISVVTAQEERQLRGKVDDIVVIIAERKLRGLLMHITQRGEGVLLGIQLRHPVQNWNALLEAEGKPQ